MFLLAVWHGQGVCGLVVSVAGGFAPWEAEYPGQSSETGSALPGVNVVDGKKAAVAGYCVLLARPIGVCRNELGG
jgi:hypothetical protein